jgi:arylsulfatase A-like enzyme
MIVRWPGTVAPGTECGEYLIIEDFFPTILELAGVEQYETVQTVDGISFMPLLTAQAPAQPDRDLYWHFPNKWGSSGPGIGTTSTIRSGDWKLVYWYKDQSVELYNITEDIGETVNLAESEPEKVKELAVKLGTYLRSVGADRPSLKATGQPVPWPDEVIGL